MRPGSERAAAARALSGGAPVAVVAHGDRASVEVLAEGIAQVGTRSPRDAQRQAEHLVEVAIVEVALPIDRDHRAAHHRIEVRLAVRPAQEPHVIAELPLRHQRGAEPLDRHVGDRVEPVEGDAEFLAEDALVVALELRLRRRQARPLRVVDEVDGEPGALGAVAQRIQQAQRVDALLVDALAALAVDELGRIAGQRGDDRHALAGEKPGEIFLARLEEDREVAAVDHLRAAAARAAHQVAEMRVQLRSAAGHVERRRAARREIVEHLVRGLARHRLGARGARVHVAMQARLVADVAHVHLQDLQPPAADGGKIGVEEKRKSGVHGACGPLRHLTNCG